MPRYARAGLAFLASLRLGERSKKAAMTENAIAIHAIRDQDCRDRFTPLCSLTNLLGVDSKR